MPRNKKDTLIMGLYTIDEMNMRNDAIFELAKEFLPRLTKFGKGVWNSIRPLFEPPIGEGSSPPPSPSPTENPNHALPDFMKKPSYFMTRPRIAELSDEEELDALKPRKPHSEGVSILA